MTQSSLFTQSFQRLPPVRAGMKIGLLGGSFNPAHKGHMHMAVQGCERLDLDAVWWMVSPHNPLKTRRDMASVQSRTLSAWKTARPHPKSYVTTFEKNLARGRTADVLRYLVNRFPSAHFVWLMGTDNWHSIHTWGKWPLIFETMPVAVIPRKTNSTKGTPVAEKTFKNYVHKFRQDKNYALLPAPAIGLLDCPTVDISSTQIRAGL